MRAWRAVAWAVTEAAADQQQAFVESRAPSCEGRSREGGVNTRVLQTTTYFKGVEVVAKLRRVAS